MNSEYPVFQEARTTAPKLDFSYIENKDKDEGRRRMKQFIQAVFQIHVDFARNLVTWIDIIF